MNDLYLYNSKYKRWEEGECAFRCWPKSWEICGCTRPLLEFERHLVDSGHNIKNGGILMQGRGNYCSKLKKGKLKKLKVV